ncbi:camp-dependent protein kinase regulatory subunit [Artomyces pyxidatus]|uniref:Camp-dependent protein kinase regulatory subunit n=1 Tax=Artomyces pyxidatus TaxID=48021 RepID=A0ACB8TKD4_9AGAM|nr:camp-dependent protein kinase regulatory subunit [Artomyces pyxidatus]
MSTFDALVADLTRDVHRVQPKDVLQFCANWFQSRLEEQRTRTRDALASRPSWVAAIPPDHFLDTRLAPASIPPDATPFTDPFEPRRTSLQNPRAQNAFGTLDFSGNAMFSSEGMPDPTTAVPPPTFRFDGGPASIDPSFSEPFMGYDSVTPSQSPSPGDYLHPPGFNILERRTSVSAEPISVDSESHEPLPVFPKSDDQLRRIKASIKDNFLFRDLDEEQETGVLNAMQEMHTTRDQVVIRQGDLGDYFYVVESGLLHVFVRKDPPQGLWPGGRSARQEVPQPGAHAEFGKLVQECRPGSSFGELALMYGHPRAATVLAMEPSTLWSLDRITFRTIILKAAHRRRTMYEQFLSTVPLLASLSATERSKIADALVSTVYVDGAAVVRQGEMGDTFFFVEEGEATVTKSHEGDDGELKELEVGHLTRGDYFGELSLLTRAPRAATVSAVHRGAGSTLPKLKVAALDAQAFTRLLGPLREIMERNAGTYGNYGSPHLSYSR